jgi:hypothetical protein
MLLILFLFTVPKRQATPKYTVKVDFGVIFCLLQFLGTLQLNGKSLDYGKT